MRKFLWLFAPMLGLIVGCDPPAEAPHPRNIYALQDGVALRADGGAVVKTLKYGESIRADDCDITTCTVSVSGKLVTAVKGEVGEEKPPMGTKYVWANVGHFGTNQQVTIEGYKPSTNSLRVNGVWVEESSLHDRPESAEEIKAREKAEALAESDAVQERREQAKKNRAQARQSAIDAEKNRKAFAFQLRENYLAAGANIKVSVSGSHAEHLTLEYPLIDDVWTYKFEHNDEAMSALRAKGFTHLHLSDGYNYGVRITL